MKPYLYIIIRSDLPSLNPGKAIAQAVHCGNILIWNNRELDLIKEWAGAMGYGVTITLKAPLHEIKYAIERAKEFGIWNISGLMVDRTYPIVIPADSLGLVDQTKLSAPFRFTDENKAVVLYREETTCAYIFGGKDELKPVLGKFELYE